MEQIKLNTKNQKSKEKEKKHLKNNNNNNKQKKKESTKKIDEIIDSDILSFRTNHDTDNTILNKCKELSNKVTKRLLINMNKSNNKNKEPKDNLEEMRKMFFQKNEKELEIFETERGDKELKVQNNNIDKNKEKYFYLKDDEGKPIKIRHLNQVICTLSKIEDGYATFVSSNDLILVIPSLFIPKNLNIGNTYNFKLGEIEQVEDKLRRINQIHNYYADEKNIENIY